MNHCLGCGLEIPEVPLKKSKFLQEGFCSLECQDKKKGEEKSKFFRIEKGKKPTFHNCQEWLELRYRAFREYGATCMNCGCRSGSLQVDHIKPRSKYPHLELEFCNLQVLCKPCNHGKRNHDEEDFRPEWAKKKYPLPSSVELAFPEFDLEFPEQ